MHLTRWLLTAATCFTICAAQPTAGIENLVRRRFPFHDDKFTFTLEDATHAGSPVNITGQPNDRYTVSNGPHDTIHISGNSQIALAYGLRYYLNAYLNVDIYWFIGSQLYLAPAEFPRVNSTYHGSSIVPWRYHFNTVTFSYTAAFWTWDDWELQLDWMALHGINLPLAWVGYEKILMDVLLEHGFTESGIASFLSGPAFQAWNRFGNIQGSWGGRLPVSWINGQFELQKKIVARMVELGMTPVLPSFTGFVPREIASVQPSAAVVNGSQWSEFPLHYTNVTFLEPFDPLFAKMQKSFIQKQRNANGDVTHIYTLDQYNENDPYSGNVDYLRNVTKNTIQALKAADPNAVWMLQGWLFYSAEDFWTDKRIEAYLGGVDDQDMVILDLFSESAPQWQRTNSYYGKPWIWCQLHDYGGNMGLYGQLENVTYNPIEALGNNTSTMVGMGLTMEGQEGNEVMYDILLDQAWSQRPLDTELYFRNWVESRYNSGSLPSGVFEAWDIIRRTVYNNTNLYLSTSVTKSIFELSPNTTGLPLNVSHHSTEITYDPDVLVRAWGCLFHAAAEEPSLWDNAAYTFDLTDVTRQVLANAFYPLYDDFVAAANRSLNSYSKGVASKKGEKMTELLSDLDAVLAASGEAHFSLAAWIASARTWAAPSQTAETSNVSSSSTTDRADFYEYNARNQITLWGPTGQIKDYASKQWAGLIQSYYVPRWEMFVEWSLNSTTKVDGENMGLSDTLLAFEEAWQHQTWGEAMGESFVEPTRGEFQRVIGEVVGRWPDVFGQ